VTLGFVSCERKYYLKALLVLAWACVEPIGFKIPKDVNGDRLKASFNDQPRFDARSGERLKDAK
jgi:hypothetical protein